jgi:hypothetical protein
METCACPTDCRKPDCYQPMQWNTFYLEMLECSKIQLALEQIDKEQYEIERELLQLVDDSLVPFVKKHFYVKGIWWLIMQGVLREHQLEEKKNVEK